MRWAFGLLLVLHGIVHFMGVAKAFGAAELPQLTQPISRGGGVLWLAAGLTMIATAVALVATSRVWWMVGLLAVLLSQTVVIASWGDAKFGTLVNALVLLGVVYGFLSEGPRSFASRYRHEVESRVAETHSAEPITEADIEHLPPLVRRYLERTGHVGGPRVQHFRARWRGRIRSTPDDPWMEFTAVQHDFVDEPARFFHLRARRGGLPVDVLHAYRDGSASMRVHLLSLIPLQDVRGPEMRQAETVTVLNDLCLLAPGALIDRRITWEEVDERSVRARYAVGSDTITATLVFDEAGELVDFVSEDRLASIDGALERWPWSTPVSRYESFGPVRVPTRGEGRWHRPAGTFTYIELELLELEINGGS